MTTEQTRRDIEDLNSWVADAERRFPRERDEARERAPGDDYAKTLFGGLILDVKDTERRQRAEFVTRLEVAARLRAQRVGLDDLPAIDEEGLRRLLELVDGLPSAVANAPLDARDLPRTHVDAAGPSSEAPPTEMLTRRSAIASGLDYLRNAR